MDIDPKVSDLYYRNTPLLIEQMEAAANAVEGVLKHGHGSFFEESHLHIVFMTPILVPISSTQDKESGLKRAMLFEHSVGPKDEWEFPYDEIARDKAFTAWLHGMDSREVIERHLKGEPLLRVGSTVWAGGIYRYNLPIGVSGKTPPGKDELLGNFAAEYVYRSLLTLVDGLNAEHLLANPNDCFITAEPALQPA
jgi:hypothetical protein